MSREQLLARPVAGKWSTLEVTAHLADFDPIIAMRMKSILAEDKPQLLAADENRFAAALPTRTATWKKNWPCIERTRSQMARILRRQTDKALQRVGVHNHSAPSRWSGS